MKRRAWILFLGLLATAVACGGTPPRSATSLSPPGVTAAGTGAAEPRSSPQPEPNPTADRTGPLSDGGAASCVESYAPSALGGRAFAFDGVVREIGDSVSDRADTGDLGLPGVTFEVREWYAGGSADTVTVDLQQPATTGGTDPTDPGYSYGVGSRLLVSGEPRWGGPPLRDPIAWGCGFSRYYDPETAAAWHEALAR